MPEITHEPVVSSNIASVGYHPDSKTLAVKFMNGGVYHYHDVPKEVHSQLMASDSKGKFLISNIRGKFRHEKVSA